MILNINTNIFSKLIIKQVQKIYTNLIVKLLKTKNTKLIL